MKFYLGGCQNPCFTGSHHLFISMKGNLSKPSRNPRWTSGKSQPKANTRCFFGAENCIFIECWKVWIAFVKIETFKKEISTDCKTKKSKIPLVVQKHKTNAYDFDGFGWIIIRINFQNGWTLVGWTLVFYVFIFGEEFCTWRFLLTCRFLSLNLSWASLVEMWYYGLRI